MANKTKIEWTDATWNPITGCSVVSAGCKHCYAMKLAGTRLQNHPSRTGLTVDTNNGPVWTGEVRFNEQWISQPIRWSRQRMVFVCAHADLFHPAVPDHWIDTVFGIMWACLYGKNEQDGHIFQVLTKRAGRMRDYFKTDRRESWARAAVNYGGGIDPDGLWDQIMGFEGPHPRIWLGVSVEDQKAADERIPLLLETSAAVRWISAEPLLGSVDLTAIRNPGGESTFPPFNALQRWGGSGVDWVVVGGESGPNARPMNPIWARSLRDQCAEAGVPFLFKQWGEWVPSKALPDDARLPAQKWGWVSEAGGEVDINHTRPFGDPTAHHELMAMVGKKASGRLLDGVQHDGYPALAGLYD